MLLYIFKSIACFAILLAFYKVVLESLSIHKFKRFFLLATLPLAFIIPWLTFTTYVEPTLDFGTFDPNSGMTPPYFPADIATDTPTTTNYLSIALWSIYGLGVLIFAFKFCLNLYRMTSKIKGHQKVKTQSFIHVLIQQLTTPHTFFYYIFLDKNAFETQQIPKEVLLHEETHARQLHSIDILLIELFQIVFWFNPLVYIAKTSIKLNHEFLADAAVLESGISKPNYQNILLAFSSNAAPQPLANAINYSLIKKRFTVMKTQSSKTSIWIRSTLLLPLLALLLYSFSNKEEVVKTDTKESALSLIVASEEATPKHHYYKDVTFKIIDNKSNTTTIKTYHELTEAEKNKLLPPPSKPISKQPSSEELSNWLDSKTYGVWVDGSRIKNSHLKDYNTDDFGIFYVSKLEKNAVNYGKHYYQVDLYTVEQFNENIKTHGKPLSKGTVITITQNDTPKKEVSHKVKQVTYSSENTEMQEGATKAQIKEYNALAHKYNTMDSDNLMITSKDVERLKYLYNLMSYKQRQNAEPFPNFPEPPPAPDAPITSNFPEVVPAAQLPPPPPIPANATPAQKASYEATLKNYQLGKAGKVRKIKGKDGKIKEVVSIPDVMDVPPPPPPPKSPIDHVIAMAKKNATFYYEGQQISSDDAIKALKSDRNLNIATQQQNSNAPKVHISTQPITTNKKGELVTKPKTLNEVKTALNEDDQGYVTINGNTYFFIIENKKVRYFDRWGQRVDENGNAISPKPSKTLKHRKPQKEAKYPKTEKTKKSQKEPKQLADNRQPVTQSVYQKMYEEYKDTHPAYRHFKDATFDQKISQEQLNNPKATFYYNDQSIDEKKAKTLIQERKDLNVQYIDGNSKNPIIYITDRPLKINNNNSIPKPNANTIVNHIKVMHRHKADFYLDNKKISYSKALKYVKAHKDANVNSSLESGVVIISSK